jgi:pentatricopeptide repeat protein
VIASFNSTGLHDHGVHSVPSFLKGKADLSRMALFLVARSLGRARVGRIFQQASRSVVIAPYDTGDETQAEGNLPAGGDESHLRDFAAFPGASVLGDSNGLNFAGMLAMQRQISMGFAMAAVAVDKRAEKTKTVNKTKSAREKAAQRQFYRRRAEGTHWWKMEEELLANLKAWPIDVDLDVLLQDRMAGGKSIDSKGVQTVIYYLAFGADIDAWEAGEEIRDTAAEIAEMAVDTYEDVPRPFNCSPEDARRALNLFEWWQRQNPDTPQLTQLNGLLKALSAGGLKEEMGALWATYKAHANDDPRLVSNFLSAYLQLGMFDETLAVYKEAQDSGLVLGGKSGDYAMQAMIAKGYPLDALWAAFTDWVERSGAASFHWRTLETLLEQGMTVEKILGLDYTCLDKVKRRLIKALTNLGRKDEASEIVQELLKEDQPSMPLIRFVSMLVTLVESGYPVEARQLADLQKRLHGLDVGPALIFKMRNMRNGYAGIHAFNTLQALEGPHRTNIAVRAELVHQCVRVRDTDKVYQVRLSFGLFMCRFFFNCSPPSGGVNVSVIPIYAGVPILTSLT